MACQRCGEDHHTMACADETFFAPARTVLDYRRSDIDAAEARGFARGVEAAARVTIRSACSEEPGGCHHASCGALRIALAKIRTLAAQDAKEVPDAER